MQLRHNVRVYHWASRCTYVEAACETQAACTPVPINRVVGRRFDRRSEQLRLTMYKDG
jgi:hypothetical protein